MKFIALLLLLGAIVSDPRYFLRVLDAFGVTKTITLVDSSTANFPTPLPVENISFQDIIYSPGQHNLGRLSVNLLPVRDPRYRDLQPYYRAIDYEDIIEVSTSPDFVSSDLAYKAIVTRPKVGNLQQQSIEGVSILKKLENAKVQRYDHRTGTADAEIRSLLSVYDPAQGFQDDFNRTTGFGANWTFSQGSEGGYSISDGYVQCVASPGPNNYLQTADSYDASEWQQCRVSFDLNFNTTLSAVGFYLYFDSAANYVSVYTSLVNGNPVVHIGSLNGISGATRDYPLSTTDWNHADVFFTPVSSGIVQCEVVINNIQMIVDTFPVTNNASPWELYLANGVAQPILIDDFVFAPSTPVFTVGDIDTTTQTFDQVFNCDTYLSVIEWYCNAMGWSYRVRPRAGFGNDFFDCGANIGRDFSSVLVVKEGDSQSKDDKQLALKILDLQPDQISEELATSLRVYGQSADDATSGFIANSLADFLTYGVIEKDYSDPRVTTSAIAKILGDARLLVTGAGNVSYSGTFLDESELLGQDPIWGSAAYGDFVWGGRKQLEAGDSFWLLSDTWGADKSARILGITRNSVDPTVQVVLDYFRWELDKAYQLLMGKFQQLVRAYSLKNQPETWDISQTGAGSQRRYFYIRGNIPSVLVDGIGQSGSANVTAITFDGNAISGTPFAIAAGSAFHLKDTTYLVLEDVHYIDVTFDGTSGLRITVSPQTLL